ncbi:MAG: hypothetical protein MJZ76_08270, partial [Bacteroidales bacterium]|nr:hypothetical protein [Bacteroidales bacterium]
YVLGELISSLPDEERQQLKSNLARIKPVKTGALMLKKEDERLASQIDVIATGGDNQPAVRTFQELKDMLLFATLSGNDKLASDVMQVIDNHLGRLEQLSPSLGAAFKEFVSRGR